MKTLGRKRHISVPDQTPGKGGGHLINFIERWLYGIHVEAITDDTQDSPAPLALNGNGKMRINRYNKADETATIGDIRPRLEECEAATFSRNKLIINGTHRPVRTVFAKNW